MIAVEQLQEAGLRAGRAFHAAGLERRDAVLDFRQIERQIVGPQARPPADGRRLRRLQVREAERRQVAILFGEVGQRDDHRRQPPGDHLQRLAHQNQVGVVGDVAACGAQVNDRPGRGALVAVGVDVGHHVVPQLALVLVGGVEIDVVDVRPAARRSAPA